MVTAARKEDTDADTEADRKIGSGKHAALTYRICLATEKAYCDFVRNHSGITDKKLLRFQDWLKMKQKKEIEELEKAREIAKRLQSLSLVTETLQSSGKVQSALVDTGASVNVIGVDTLSEGTCMHRTNGNIRGADGKNLKVLGMARLRYGIKRVDVGST